MEKHPTHIADVVCYFRCCSEAFARLAALSKAIKAEGKNIKQLHLLADAALYIADDFEDLAGCWQEEVESNGVRGKAAVVAKGDMLVIEVEKTGGLHA